IGTFSGLFTPLNGKSRLYRRIDQPVAGASLEFPSSGATPMARQAGEAEAESPAPTRAPTPNLQALADRVLIQRLSPVGVLCNQKGDILYISGRAGKYLEPAVGKANLNVFAMARDGLRYELS